MQRPKTYEQEHAEDLERIRNFCLMDDEFMSAVLSDNPRAIELVLQIILESPTLKVAYSHTQESIHNLFGKDVKTENHFDLCTELPFPDDTVIREVLCNGRKIIKVKPIG